VYTTLLTFFSRYYDNGDFISQRRYKGDTYAIPMQVKKWCCTGQTKTSITPRAVKTFQLRFQA